MLIPAIPIHALFCSMQKELVQFNGQANTAWGPRQVQGDHSNFQNVRLPFGSAQSAFSNMVSQNEIGHRCEPR